MNYDQLRDINKRMDEIVERLKKIESITQQNLEESRARGAGIGNDIGCLIVVAIIVLIVVFFMD